MLSHGLRRCGTKTIGDGDVVAAVALTVLQQTLEFTSPLLALDNDTLGLVLRAVRGKDRMAVMLSCKRLCEVALSRGWPPWSHSCRGLVFAVRHGLVQYFVHHARIAGDRLNLRPWSRALCCRAIASRNVAMLEVLLNDERVDATQGSDDICTNLVRIQGAKTHDRFVVLLARHGMRRNRDFAFAGHACALIRSSVTLRQLVDDSPPLLWTACMNNMTTTLTCRPSKKLVCECVRLFTSVGER